MRGIVIEVSHLRYRAMKIYYSVCICIVGVIDLPPAYSDESSSDEEA